ncbi:MAG: hypothetical protein NWE76_04005 [Candidatus Bathyarchaeota archaeon]|nr:hypothetical protein [Candidatus Bathyarchaeota archaeon]
MRGSKDEDDSSKKSLQKYDAAGKPVKHQKKDATELFNERIESGRMEELVEKVFNAWEKGLDSDNEKLATDTAAKFTRAFYNPDKKVVVEGMDQNEVHMNILNMHDNLSPKEAEALAKFQNFLEKGAKQEGPEEDIIDVEVEE